MQNISIPPTAVPSDLSGRIRLAVVSSTERPPEGLGWLHEIKHDGHRLAAILDGSGGLKLISRNGNDRTPLFRAPFDGLLSAGRQLVLDGEIAVPDDRGVTHIAIAERRPERLAYFAFDLMHLDGHDLRPCPIEARKELLRRVLEDARCPRLVYVDHVTGHGAELFERVQAIGAEGIVSKRIGSPYRGGQLRDWRKTKCHATASFVITGFQELGPGRLEALHVAEKRETGLVPAGQVRFGFAGKGLWAMLDALRTGPPGKGGAVSIEPGLNAAVKFFGRYKGGAIRDGVLLSIERLPVPRLAAAR